MEKMTDQLRDRDSFVLTEVLAAAATIALVSLALATALTGALQIFHIAQTVTRSRLLAASHLEQAAAGVAVQQLWDGDLRSTLSSTEVDGHVLWQAVVEGPGLAKPLRLVGGP